MNAVDKAVSVAITDSAIISFAEALARGTTCPSYFEGRAHFAVDHAYVVGMIPRPTEDLLREVLRAWSEYAMKEAA